MTYEQSKEYLVNDLIPGAWKTILENKREAEIFLYKLILKCMQTCSDVSAEFSENNTMVKIIKSWIADDSNDLGTNSIYLSEIENNTVIIGCYFDIDKLREDLEVLSFNLFGEIDFAKIDEDKIGGALSFDDNSTDSLINAIQVESPLKRKRIKESESK